jgi:cell division protein FtsB
LGVFVNFMAQRIRKKLGSSLFLAAAFAYLAFHALHGEQGLYALVAQRYEQEKLRAELADVRERRLALERRVRLMRDASVDPDLLDEQARRYLGLAASDDLVFFLPPSSSPKEARAIGAPQHRF